MTRQLLCKNSAEVSELRGKSHGVDGNVSLPPTYLHLPDFGQNSALHPFGDIEMSSEEIRAWYAQSITSAILYSNSFKSPLQGHLDKYQGANMFKAHAADVYVVRLSTYHYSPCRHQGIRNRDASAKESPLAAIKVCCCRLPFHSCGEIYALRLLC